MSLSISVSVSILMSLSLLLLLLSSLLSSLQTDPLQMHALDARVIAQSALLLEMPFASLWTSFQLSETLSKACPGFPLENTSHSHTSLGRVGHVWSCTRVEPCFSLLPPFISFILLFLISFPSVSFHFLCDLDFCLDLGCTRARNSLLHVHGLVVQEPAADPGVAAGLYILKRGV